MCSHHLTRTILALNAAAWLGRATVRSVEVGVAPRTRVARTLSRVPSNESRVLHAVSSKTHDPHATTAAIEAATASKTRVVVLPPRSVAAPHPGRLAAFWRSLARSSSGEIVVIPVGWWKENHHRRARAVAACSGRSLLWHDRGTHTYDASGIPAPASGAADRRHGGC